jgi:hypothetical protein
VDSLGEKLKKLTGDDVLVSSGLLASLGPSTAVYRQKQMNLWVEELKRRSLALTTRPSPHSWRSCPHPPMEHRWSSHGQLLSGQRDHRLQCSSLAIDD